MDCDAPTTFEELREWRAEDGIPRNFHAQILSLEGALLADLANAGCDVFYDKVFLGGPCETDNGYIVDGESDPYDETSFAITIVATDVATGSLPTGWITYDAHSSFDGGAWGGQSRSFQLAWAFEDPAGSELGVEGDVYSSTSSWNDECEVAESASLSANWQGCDIGISWREEALNDWPDPVLERESFALNEWSASVTTYACRSVVGVIDGRTAFLDDDWHEIARTDADGDLCAAEDCDCDDADAAVSPNVYDAVGDGVDADCDGRDGSGWDCDSWDRYNDCVFAADDSGTDDSGTDESGGDDSPSEDTAPADTATVPPRAYPAANSGLCATPAAPGLALLAGLAALFRRRR